MLAVVHKTAYNTNEGDGAALMIDRVLLLCSLLVGQTAASGGEDLKADVRRLTVTLKDDAGGKNGGKGDWSNLCAAPEGPFRQIGPVPFSAVLRAVPANWT